MKRIATALLLVVALSACVDVEANNREQKKIEACTERGGIPAFHYNNMSEVLTYYGCTEAQP